ncbi:MAG: hypothetical protein WC518_00850 [Patescibacteria group bacterium]
MLLDCGAYLELPGNLQRELARPLAELNQELGNLWQRVGALEEGQGDYRALAQEVFEQLLAEVKMWVRGIAAREVLDSGRQAELARAARNFQLRVIEAVYTLGIEFSSTVLVEEPSAAAAVVG